MANLSAERSSESLVASLLLFCVVGVLTCWQLQRVARYVRQKSKNMWIPSKLFQIFMSLSLPRLPEHAKRYSLPRFSSLR